MTQAKKQPPVENHPLYDEYMSRHREYAEAKELFQQAKTPAQKKVAKDHLNQKEAAFHQIADKIE